LVFLALLNVAWFDPVKDGVDESNRQYYLGNYDEALKGYTQAQTERPDEPEIHYDIGNVQVRKNDPLQAAKEYQQAATSTLDKTVQSRSLYNLGNALMMQGNAGEAVEAYKGALRLNPKDEDAKYNLELAMLQMMQQPQQQQEQDQDQEQQPTPTGTQEAGESQQQTPQQEGEESTPSPAEGGQAQEATETPTPTPAQQIGDQTPTASPTQMDMEQFERLLDRLDQKELEIKKQLQGTPPPFNVEKDW